MRQELADAAFNLLSSSTLDRFIAKAKYAAQRSTLGEQAKRNPALYSQLIFSAQELWRDLILSEQRDVPEVELAIILSFLAQTAHPEVDGLLGLASSMELPSTLWISGLAKQLKMDRPTSKEYQYGFEAHPARDYHASMYGRVGVRTAITNQQNDKKQVLPEEIKSPYQWQSEPN